MSWVTLGLQVVAGAGALTAIGAAVNINKEWEECVVLRLGRYNRIMKAGLFFTWPFIEGIIRRDVRIKTMDIPSQEAITKDNISVNIDAVVFLKVIDSRKSVLNIRDYSTAIRQISQTTLRDVIGQETLDTLLEKRTIVAKKIKDAIDKDVEEWGVDIINIELQNIGLPEDMKRAFAIQAEAEREAKAVKIKAQAELDASTTLRKAGDELMKNPIGLQLRQLAALSDVSKDESNTIILALPTETLVGGGLSAVAALSSINSSSARRKLWYKGKGKKSTKKKAQK